VPRNGKVGALNDAMTTGVYASGTWISFASSTESPVDDALTDVQAAAPTARAERTAIVRARGRCRFDRSGFGGMREVRSRRLLSMVVPPSSCRLERIMEPGHDRVPSIRP
jgi:hypothetical protein